MYVAAGGIRTSQSWFVEKTSSLENFLVTFLREREEQRRGQRQTHTHRAGKDERQEY